MARRRKRKRRTTNRQSQVRDGRKILATESDDRVAAFSLGKIFKETNDVLDATDLNESFNYFEQKNMKNKRRN